MSDIRKRKGKKGATYQVRFPDSSTERGYVYKTFSTLKEARAFREDASARNLTSPNKLEITTITQAVERWLDICEKEGLNGREPVTAYTLKNYQYRTDIINRYDWDKAIYELCSPDIVKFRAWLLRSGLSRDLARKVLTTLQSVFKEMTLQGHLANNVASGINVRSDSRYDVPIIIPSKGDVLALLSAANRLSNSKNQKIAQAWQRYRPMLYLAADSGMRPQEYLAISKSDLKTNGISVEKAIEGDGSKITVTKTPAGRRFIELSSDTIDIVRHYADNYAPPSPHGLVFPCSNGRWQCRRNWQRSGFNAACLDAGLVDAVPFNDTIKQKPRYRPYDLRHFYASMLFEKKVNLKKIQVLMGHTKIETTLNVYGHLLDDPALQTEQRGILNDIGLNSCGKSVANPL